MEGVILFADDKVFSESFEREFFQSLVNEKKYPVLAVDNLELLEKTTRSISTYKALIVDWNFERSEELDEDGIDMPDETSADFLMNAEIFSLIYIYSDKEVALTEDGKKLIEKYGTKIKFKKKINAEASTQESAASEKKLILAEIAEFEKLNPSLKVPFIWSQSINKAMQEIFRELEIADPNWIKEIYNNSKADGGEPISEVIGVFQHVLAESIIQNSNLKTSIINIVDADEIPVANKEESLAKLYNRLFYTRVLPEAPIMTGDIFILDNETSAILITPECDVETKKENVLDFLIIRKGAFNNYLNTQHTFKKENFAASKPKHIDTIVKSFNQDAAKYHLLPSFPFTPNIYNETALIEFPFALVQLHKKEFENKRGNYKLNSPYIHQLRQRYLAYIGRVGVPAIPNSLRLFNIK